MLMFNCPSAEETIHKRNLKFLSKYATADNLMFCLSDIAVCVIVRHTHIVLLLLLNYFV